jgi:hypothetical protein
MMWRQTIGLSNGGVPLNPNTVYALRTSFVLREGFLEDGDGPEAANELTWILPSEQVLGESMIGLRSM